MTFIWQLLFILLVSIIINWFLYSFMCSFKLWVKMLLQSFLTLLCLVSIYLNMLPFSLHQALKGKKLFSKYEQNLLTFTQVSYIRKIQEKPFTCVLHSTFLVSFIRHSQLESFPSILLTSVNEYRIISRLLRVIDE